MDDDSVQPNGFNPYTPVFLKHKSPLALYLAWDRKGIYTKTALNCAFSSGLNFNRKGQIVKPTS